MTWHDAVISAIIRLSDRNASRLITRQQLIDEELGRIIHETNSQGVTPWQTLSRVLQELRNDRVIYFLRDGKYLLLDKPINLEDEDLPNAAIDFAIKQNKLRIGTIPVDDKIAQIRIRKGQSRLRHLVLKNYQDKCAFCDITQKILLIASHISRWADDPKARGNLTNVICMCRFHDVLFENGIIALSDDYRILKKLTRPQPIVISSLLNDTRDFCAPTIYPPSAKFLRKHRARTGFEEI